MSADPRVGPLLQKIADLERRLGQVERSGVRAQTYSFTNLPKAVLPGVVIFVPDATFGAVLAMADGQTWLEFQPVGVLS